MAYVSNNNYLELAKLDYNNCQALHLKEWEEIQKWYTESRLGEFGLSKRALLLAYFLAAANIFEPERSHQRIAWAKTNALLEIITSYITDPEMRKDFVKKFSDCISRPNNYSNGWRLNRNKTGHGLAETLVATMDQISWDILVSYCHDIGSDIHHGWKNWLSSWQIEGDKCEGQAELLVQILNLCAGNQISKELIMSNPKYQHLIQVFNSLTHSPIDFIPVKRTRSVPRIN